MTPTPSRPSLWRRRWLDLLVALALIPAALVAALVMKDTFSVGQTLQIDARVAGVAAATIAVWRRASFVVVIVVGAGVTALVRQL